MEFHAKQDPSDKKLGRFFLMGGTLNAVTSPPSNKILFGMIAKNLGFAISALIRHAFPKPQITNPRVQKIFFERVRPSLGQEDKFSASKYESDQSSNEVFPGESLSGV